MRLISAGLVASLLAIPALASNLQSPLVPQEGSGPVSRNWTESLLTLHKHLITIESTSGHENAVGHYLKSLLESHNFTVITQDLPPLEANPQKARRFNVYAFNGRSPKSSVLITSHMDTVPPFYNYSLEAGNEIWGRGSVDAKGAVATQITAALQLLEAGEVGRGDVSLLFVVGEEVDGGGMKRANELNLHWDAGIFGEPTELKLAEGHKGIVSGYVRATGKAAHSGYPWLGVNANSKLIKALAILDEMQLGYSEKYGNTTINIGRIDGGVAGNVVPESAKAEFTIRLAVGPVKDIREKIIKALGEDVDIEFRGGYSPVDCNADVEGFDTITVNYGTDVPWLEHERVPSRYLYGPGSILVAHSDHEHLNVKDLEEAVEGYKKLILHALKK